MQQEELAALEWVMQVHMQKRVNVGAMMCGQVSDVQWDNTVYSSSALPCHTVNQTSSLPSTTITGEATMRRVAAWTMCLRQHTTT